MVHLKMLPVFPDSRVLLLFTGDSVYRERIAGRPVLQSCDDITGDTRYPNHVGELEQIEEPISESDMLLRIEQPERSLSRLVPMKIWCVCRLCPIEGRDCEGQILSSRTAFDVCAESSVPAVVSRVITPGLERVGRQTGLGHTVISFITRDTFWRRLLLGHLEPNAS